MMQVYKFYYIYVDFFSKKHNRQITHMTEEKWQGSPRDYSLFLYYRNLFQTFPLRLSESLKHTIHQIIEAVIQVHARHYCYRRNDQTNDQENWH